MEEIEILDFDDDNDNKSIDKKDKKVVKEKKDKSKKKEKSKKDKKSKRKLRKVEKIFLLVNIFVILGIIGFYAYRTYYYYKLSHTVLENVLLKDKITSLDKIAFKDDGLYEKDGYFYFKGEDVDNYIYFSGRLFRIIDIDQKGIRIIEDETPSNLVWSIDGNFEDSLVKKWLDDYLNTINDKDLFLEENTWCNESVTIDNYNCQNTIDSYVGLLSTKDYLNAGGKSSYLNNETFFWTINTDSDGKVFYINDEGSINNLSKDDDNYFSYGIRPVITLKGDVILSSGEGTENDPYVIEELGKTLLRDNSIGSYVTYLDKSYRILSVDEDGVSLILDSVIEIEKNYNDIYKYLNNDFLKTLNKDDLVKQNYTVNTYNLGNKYQYKDNKKGGSEYVIIPQIGDMFLNDYDNYWLSSLQDSTLGLYYTIDENNMFFGDLKANKHYLRPIIKVKDDLVISGGNGMKEDPLVIGDNNEETVE